MLRYEYPSKQCINSGYTILIVAYIFVSYVIIKNNCLKINIRMIVSSDLCILLILISAILLIFSRKSLVISGSHKWICKNIHTYLCINIHTYLCINICCNRSDLHTTAVDCVPIHPIYWILYVDWLDLIRFRKDFSACSQIKFRRHPALLGKLFIIYNAFFFSSFAWITKLACFIWRKSF